MSENDGPPIAQARVSLYLFPDGSFGMGEHDKEIVSEWCGEHDRYFSIILVRGPMPDPIPPGCRELLSTAERGGLLFRPPGGAKP